MLTRRRFVASAITLSATRALPRGLSRGMPAQTMPTPPDAAATAALRVLPGNPLTVLPANFTGLGYEESSVARRGLLEPGNTLNVQLLRNLGPGVLRAGGIVADFTTYSAQGQALSEPRNTVVTQARFEQLRGFLDAVDWTAIWSVNFGRGTLEEAIAETTAVSRILGPRLLAIELGNEVENYGHGNTPLRPAPYAYENYLAEFKRWSGALRAAAPHIHFAGPDTAASVEWVESMAAGERGDVQLLTTHYYRGSQKLGNRDQLLLPDPDLKAKLERLRTASIRSGIPWRMCEINSFFGGGRPGVSDTLTGALWTLDTMLLLAHYGCAGVNMETGFNHLGFLSSYSPIRNTEAGEVSVGAPYYGMLAFALSVADGLEMLPVQLDVAGSNVSGYALGRDGRPGCVVVINKSPERSLRVSLRQIQIQNGSVLRLAGLSLDSGDRITLGGAAVDSAGHWQAQEAEPLRDEVSIAPGTAVLLRARP